MVAPAPERPIDGGMATEALIVHVVVSKFCDSLAAVSPVADAGAAGHLAGPLDVEQLGGQRLLVADTALRPGGQHGAVLEPTVCRRYDVAGARPWSWPNQDGAVVVLRGRRPAVVRRHLTLRPRMCIPRTARACVLPHIWRTSSGVLQVDGYDGFKRLAGDRVDHSVRLAFCWAHMRRALLRVPCLHQITARRRGAGTHPRPLRDRSGDPRPFRRTSKTGATGAKSTDRRGPACLAAGSRRTCLWHL